MQFLNRKLNTCIITAGGEGSRLKTITKGMPKPLFPIDGISCLERSIKLVKGFNIKNIFILTCYRKELLIDKVNEYNKKYLLNIKVIQEDSPLGECGGLWLLKKELKDEILLINADLIWNIDIKRFFTFHIEHDSDVTLLTHACTHAKDSDLLSESSNKQILNFSLKPHKNNIIPNMYLGNSGIALFNSKILSKINPPKEKPSFCNHILNNINTSNLKVFSYNTSEFVKDIGTPERFVQVERILESNLVNSKSYINKQKCLFIDRDNTLIECADKEYIININQVKLMKDNISKIALIRNKYDLAIIITNQPQISMGLASWDKVISINSYVIQKCLALGLKIDTFSLCPHHYHSGFDGEIIELKQDCFCRKPKPGLFLKESYFRNIELSESVMIGDSETDEIASLRAGCNFINVSNL